MAWFKVDDKFHSSEEVKAIPREHRVAAIGLWTLAGAWSADHLKDGFVPTYMLDDLAGTVELANALVETKLWRKVRQGFQFRNWERWQPTRADVEKVRQAERDRKAAYRSAKHTNTGVRPVVVPQGQSEVPDTPTRPDPTRPVLIKNKDVQAPLELKNDFDEFWSVYPRKEGKDAARRKYMAVRKTVTAKSLLDGARSYALMSAGKDREFVKMAQGWMNDGRYGDDHGGSRVPSVSLPARSGDSRDCSIHPGYPQPCDACAREGRDF